MNSPLGSCTARTKVIIIIHLVMAIIFDNSYCVYTLLCMEYLSHTVCTFSTKCSASFTRAKDAAYHEKKCEECQCTTCHKIFSSLLNLEKHMNVHRGNYKCETCHKAFATKYTLVRHTKVHSKESDYACHFCNAKFKS